MLTLAGHGFYWFELAKPAEPGRPTSTRTGSRPPPARSPTRLLAAGVVSAAEETPGDSDADGRHRGGPPMKALTDLFREWMPDQRWFGGKGREWADVTEDGFFLDRRRPGALGAPGPGQLRRRRARETYLVPLSWRDHPAEELASAFVGAVPGDGRRDLRLRRDARPRRDRAVADPPGRRLDGRADALPPGRRRLHPGGPAGRHRLRRAEQHLADLRRTRRSSSCSAGWSRASTPTSRSTTRCAQHGEPAHRPAARAHRDRRRRPRRRTGDGRDAADVRAQRQRRLAAGHGQRARPLRRGRPARRRGGRRLRRARASGWARPPPSVHADLAAVLPTEPADRDWYAAVAGR